jgi:hypothetical protein
VSSPLFQIIRARLITAATLLFNLKEQRARSIAILCVSMLSIGAALRLSQYFANRSFWFDEAMLAWNIINRSFVELAVPLDYAQGAPIGFLFLQKLLTMLFGNTDYVLRIFPLICGLTSIWAMYELAKRVLPQCVAVIAAVVLFAFSDQLIYYASEAKQYSSDVVICLLLLLAIVRCLDRKLSRRHFAVLAALGAAALWFCHPALFILAGAGSALCAHFITSRDRRSTLLMGGVAGFWLVSLIIFYFVSLRELSANQLLVSFWQESFMPFPPWRDWGWFINTLRSVMADPIGLPGPSAALLLAVGGISICVRRWQLGLMLLLPILLTLIVSALQKYPFSGRLLLFIVPIILLCVAEAVGRVHSLLDRLTRLPRIGLSVALAVLTWVAIIPAGRAGWHLWRPRLVEEIKPVIAYLSAHRQDNDVVYVYYGAEPVFRYYLPFYGLEKVHVVWGCAPRGAPLPFLACPQKPDRNYRSENRQNLNVYFHQLNQLHGKGRVWILFSHVSFPRANEEALFLEHLDLIGRRLDQLNTKGSGLYLYDLE